MLVADDGELSRAVRDSFDGPWPLPVAAAGELILAPGMLFGTSEAWWPGGCRQSLHEGLDLCGFREAGGREHWLPAGTAVAPTLPGRLVARLPDFLGQTLVLHHGALAGRSEHLFTLYAHLQPDSGRSIGQHLDQSQHLGGIAAPPASSRLLPHLHLSVLLAEPDRLAAIHDWPTLIATPVRFIDPLPLLAVDQRERVGGRARRQEF